MNTLLLHATTMTLHNTEREADACATLAGTHSSIEVEVEVEVVASAEHMLVESLSIGALYGDEDGDANVCTAATDSGTRTDAGDQRGTIDRSIRDGSMVRQLQCNGSGPDESGRLPSLRLNVAPCAYPSNVASILFEILAHPAST